MSSDIIIICAKDSSELALELGLVYAMMQTSTHLIGVPAPNGKSTNLDFFRELGGQIHDTEISSLLASYPSAQIIRL